MCVEEVCIYLFIVQPSLSLVNLKALDLGLCIHWLLTGFLATYAMGC